MNIHTSKLDNSPNLYAPQIDFYQYVNHVWLNDLKNAIPDDYSSWGGFTKLHDDIIILYADYAIFQT